MERAVDKEWMSGREASLNPWRMPSSEEVGFSREVSRRRGGDILESFVAQVMDGGNRRRVGMLSDPEKKVEEKMPLMMKVSDVKWEEGIGGVEAALYEAEVEF